MIDILVPVLGRPQNAAPLVDSVTEATQVPHRILFLCSEGDDEQIAACRGTGADLLIQDFGEKSQYPRKMNAGFRHTSQPFLLLGADDLSFRAGWDQEALRVAEETNAGVIGTNDRANAHVKRGYFSTHALVRRAYIQEMGGSLDGPGILISEAYDHNFCDRELCHLAQARGQWAFAAYSHIIHRHPCWGTAPDDATYQKGHATMGEDQLLFWRRSKEWGEMGLLPVERNWIRRAYKGKI